MCVHIAQWIRYYYSDLLALKQLVPVTGFICVYVLTLFGFKSSRLLTFNNRSGSVNLSTYKISHYSGKLLKLMEQDKVYTNPGLTMNDLTDYMEIPTYQLSQLINQVFGKGFNEFVNFYRVEEVKRLLNNQSFSHLTIEALSEEAGFNSKSSFYSAFKKQTGTTPIAFQKQSDLSEFAN